MTTENFDRKLSHIEKIEQIIPIDGADRIVQYRVLNWKIIDQIGKYSVGDVVVYCEPDAFIPNSVAPFLTRADRFPKEYMGITGERLKTIKLKGVYSEGLILPLSSLPETSPNDIGSDVSENLGIVKWEPPAEKVPANALGSFPWFIPKTGTERIQNVMRSIEAFIQRNPGVTFSVTEKCEGSSHTMYVKDGIFGVASKNLELKTDDLAACLGNHFLKPVFEAQLDKKLLALGRNIAIQSEVCGEPGIQDNIYQLKGQHLFNFNVWDIDTGAYLEPKEQRKIAALLGMQIAPLIYDEFVLDGKTADELLQLADGPTAIGKTGTLREGLIFVANSKERFDFKVVSQKYLAKHDK